jgi:hypothetical protein
VLVDGTLIPARRRSGTANLSNYNGKLEARAAAPRAHRPGRQPDLDLLSADLVIITGCKATLTRKPNPPSAPWNSTSRGCLHSAAIIPDSVPPGLPKDPGHRPPPPYSSHRLRQLDCALI